MNKGNQKLYLPVKNKTNLSINWKTKLKQGAKWGIKQCKQNKTNKYVERKRKNRYAKLEVDAAAAAAAKSLQSCPTLCNPIDSSPPGSSVPGILKARILEDGAIFFSNS